MEVIFASARRFGALVPFAVGVFCLIYLAVALGRSVPAKVAAAPSPGPCQALFLDFAGLPAGTILNEQFAGNGIHISATGFPGSEDAVIIFDSNGTGTRETDDIEVDIGNVAIIPKDLTDKNRDGLVDVPEDSAAGGVQRYSFDHDRIVTSFIFVDKDARGPGTATALNASNDVVREVPIPNKGNASVQTIVMNASAVRRLEVSYNDSGAVTGINLDCVPTAVVAPPPPPQAPSIPPAAPAISPPVTQAPPVAAPGPTPIVAGVSAVSLPSGGGSPSGESTAVAPILLMALAGLGLSCLVVAMVYRRNQKLPVAPVLVRKMRSDWRPVENYRREEGSGVRWIYRSRRGFYKG